VPAGPQRSRRHTALVVLAWLAFLVAMWLPAFWASNGEVSFTVLENRVVAGEVRSINVESSGQVQGTFTDGKTFRSRIPTPLDSARFTDELRTAKVDVKARPSSSFGGFLKDLLPFFLMGLVIWWIMGGLRRPFAGGLAGIGGFGKARARIIEAERPNTTFDDIAGYEGVKEEIGEVVDFLRNPERFAAAGAKGPRGVLMVGPPGTGKTLFARAVAGQANVPFFSVTGSAFVEMFVGVGASRVRDLFNQGREKAPSIIFIDEVDAIGGRRGVHLAGGNDEREQTLNQLLAEMDGFDGSQGVVVLAATNRPEMLDPALLRPGRFDRQVVIPLPSLPERAAVLRVHARGKHLDPGVDLDRVARATPGFSGADLANLLNEAAIHAVRGGRSDVRAEDIDAARDRILLGRRDASNALLEDERLRVAVHESGHALVAELCPHADPVEKVTILPAGHALGATEQLPAADRRLYSEAYLLDLLAVRLGGRAAEVVVFGEGSTGAADDLAGATQVAHRMVAEFGLSPTLGPVGYALGGGAYLTGAPERPAVSEATQRVIDEEVSRLVRDAESRAIALLRSHRSALQRLADLLQAQETVDGAEVEHVLATTPAQGEGPAVGAPQSGRPTLP
jgi:cell division protease FtsH